MLYHKFDANTKIYTESVESETPLDNSTPIALPDITEHFTVAFRDGKWVSVLRPELKIIKGEIVEVKNEEEIIEEPIIEN